MHSITVALVAVSLAACTSTYHPEYHPVTTTTVTQTYGAPATVVNGASAQRPAVVVAPAPSAPIVVQGPPAANPESFFDTSTAEVTMSRSLLVASLFACALGGCASEYHPEYHPETATTFNQTVNYGTLIEPGAASPPSEATSTGTTPTDPAKILVLQSAHLDRPSEVVGVVDAHLKVGDQDAALAALRKRAAQLGADAVVGVEFHHAENPGEPIHLSGLAVRFLPTLPLSGR